MLLLLFRLFVMKSDESNQSVPDVERPVEVIRGYRRKDYSVYDYTIYSLPVAIALTIFTPFLFFNENITSVVPEAIVAFPVVLGWGVFWGLFFLGGYYEWKHKSLSPGLCNHCGGVLTGDAAKDKTLDCEDCGVAHNRVNAH